MEKIAFTTCKYCLVNMLRNYLTTLVIISELTGAEYLNQHSNLRLPTDVVPVDYK